MKPIFFLLLLSNIAHAQNPMTFFKDKGCIANAPVLMLYDITQKLDPHHYEMVRHAEPYYSNEKHAILETNKTVFLKIPDVLSIHMEYLGTKEVEMKNGFTDTVDLWRECEPGKAPDYMSQELKDRAKAHPISDETPMSKCQNLCIEKENKHKFNKNEDLSDCLSSCRE